MNKESKKILSILVPVIILLIGIIIAVGLRGNAPVPKYVGDISYIIPRTTTIFHSNLCMNDSVKLESVFGQNYQDKPNYDAYCFIDTITPTDLQNYEVLCACFYAP